MSFTIRTARPEDAPAVNSVLSACYPTLMPAGYPPEVMERVLPIITRSNPALLGAGTYYLAEAADGTPAGCGGWSFDWPGEPARPQQAGLAHVRHFATHPGWLRRGVGRALLDRCFADAAEAGALRMMCYASLVAEEFYASAGFLVTGWNSMEFPPGNRFDSIVMERDL
ncbi:GNAT family N-acetyltransferase [Azospirillum sp. 11R-A]|uniref:GNAT family N-acetyltransferase n=1 Tax=Azospirillum sp. 11R-A TaxID=3111634 RepID=UPI003C136F97